MVTVNIWHPPTLTPSLPPPPPPAPFLSHKAFSKPVTEDKTNGFSFRPGEKADNDADSKEGGGGGEKGEKEEEEEEEERVTLLDAWMVSAEEGQRVNTCLQVRLSLYILHVPSGETTHTNLPTLQHPTHA